MMNRVRGRCGAALLLLTLAGCGGTGALPTLGDSRDLPTRPSIDDELGADVREAEQRGCDYLDPSYCLFPWPNDHFTVADAGTDTGRRVALQPRAMPINLAGLPLQPEEWNRNDGFSPGQMLLVHVPGLDAAATGYADVTDIEASLAPGAPILVIDTLTGERHPVWAEIDASDTAQSLCEGPAGLTEVLALVGGEVGLEAPLVALAEALATGGSACVAALQPFLAELGARLSDSGVAPSNALKEDPPALLIRPGVNFRDGRRYIVALRHLRDAEGETLEAPAGFRVFRDRHESALAAINERRPAMESMFATLADAGVARDELYLAWDFTVASTRNTAGRLLHMRDTALAALGGNAPAFSIDEVIDFEEGDSLRRVFGRITVPNFLTVPDGLCDNLPVPVVRELLDYCDTLAQLGERLGAAPGLDALLGPVSDALGLVTELAQLPLSRLWYGLPAGEQPMIFPLQPTQDFRFQCEIPRSAAGRFDDERTWVRPATPTLYGHGLLGGKGEVGGGSTRVLRQHNFMHCAIDWIGMASRDVPSVLTFLLDMSFFPTLPDRVQQSVVNWHVLTRLLLHPEGLSAHPAFRTADGRAVFDPARVVYDGNSQGGIIGGVVMATSTDITRGSLGVPGMNYSTLLRRSVDFDAYGALLYLAYPNSFDQSFILSFIQMLWDRAETNGYAEHLRRPEAFTALGHPTPEHEVILNTAFGDHQVADVTAEIMARTWGAGVHRPGTEPGRHSNRNPYWGLRDLVDGEGGSAVVVWDIGPLDNPFNPGTATSPTVNVPPREGRDPHSDPRAEPAGGLQRAAFLLDNRYRNVCGDRPCFARDYVSAEVVNGGRGNLPPQVRAPGPVLAPPGTEVPLLALAADPDRDELRYRWSLEVPPGCDARLIDADQAQARLQRDAACTQALSVAVTVEDGRGGSATDRVEVRP